MPSFDNQIVERRQHVRTAATATGRRGPIAVDAADAARIVALLTELGVQAAQVSQYPGAGTLSRDMGARVGELFALLRIETSGG